MEDGIHWENKKHKEIMKRIWESYRDRAEAENRRHEDSVTAIYEMYQERSSVHVNTARELGSKVAAEAKAAHEDDPVDMEVVEKALTKEIIMERCVWTRAEDLVPGGSAFDRTEGVKINGQCVQVSWFAGESRVNLVEVNGDAIFGVCPKGIVSAVAGRVSGYAVFGRHLRGFSKFHTRSIALGEAFCPPSLPYCIFGDSQAPVAFAEKMLYCCNHPSGRSFRNERRHLSDLQQ